MDEGTKILATVDGKLKTIYESSIRRNLKLNDEEGISTLPDAELFENLALMGYNILPNQKFTFQKGQFSHQWKYLIHTIMQCLSPKSTGFNEFSSNIATAVGEGSGTPTKPHLTPSPEAQQSPHIAPLSPSQPTETTKLIPTSTPTEIPTLRQYSRRARIAQSTTLPSAADEPTSLFRDDKMATKIAAQELEIASLKAMIKLLEDKDGGGVESSGEDATIKGRSLETGEEAGVEKSTERGKVSTVGIPTGSGMVPTASSIFTTASVVTPYSRRKGKEKMIKSDTPKKKKLQEQIDVQMLIDGLDRNNKVIARHLHEYEQAVAELTIGEKIELINELVKYQDHHAKILKVDLQALASGPLLTGSSLLAALSKAREDDERHQEIRQDRPDQIMLQQVGAIRGTANKSTGYGNVQSYITSTFIVIGQQSIEYGNVQSYITSTFNVIGQQSTKGKTSHQHLMARIW
nr:hypothetical protein [Tanacetum cinerariifolium]